MSTVVAEAILVVVAAGLVGVIYLVGLVASYVDGLADRTECESTEGPPFHVA